jgi:LCP family protein required for cell wall assembly
MASGPRPPQPPDEPRAGGTYKRYRARPSLFGPRNGDDALAALRRRDRADGGPPSPPGRRGGRSGRRIPGLRRPVTPRRVVKWVVLTALGWILLSLVVFLISAQIESGKISGAVDNELAGGFPLTAKSTILVLGSDARVKGHAEPGASTIGGPSRSDSILLIRTGAGASARLSIPRDTVVDIPGHGRDKINAAYAYGGAALAVRTIKDYLHIKINHLVEVDFANFPKLVDAMGGIDYTGSCVVSEINGGRKNGGQSLHLPAGTHHINGRQALILARTRHNLCNPRESDLTRALRQQKILAAMKNRLVSPGTFFRLPFVAWAAPKAIRSDMSGPSLLGLFASMAVGGTPPTRVLKPSGGIVLPNGGDALVVSDHERALEVHRFLKG